MNEIIIENGEKRKCPFCNAIYAIDNGSQILYRNVSLVYMDKAKSITEIKCKQCKNTIAIDCKGVAKIKT